MCLCQKCEAKKTTVNSPYAASRRSLPIKYGNFNPVFVFLTLAAVVRRIYAHLYKMISLLRKKKWRKSVEWRHFGAVYERPMVIDQLCDVVKIFLFSFCIEISFWSKYAPLVQLDIPFINICLFQNLSGNFHFSKENCARLIKMREKFWKISTGFSFKEWFKFDFNMIVAFFSACFTHSHFFDTLV